MLHPITLRHAKRSVAASMLVLTIFALGLNSCRDEQSAAIKQGKLQINITGLPQLSSAFVYEGWLIVNGAPISTGKFTVDQGGELSRSYFSASVDELKKATTYVLTVEPSTDRDPQPSARHVLAGTFDDNSAHLTILKSTETNWIAATEDSHSTSFNTYGIAVKTGSRAW